MPITPSPAALRACEVLEHLAAHPEESFTVSELARRLGIPRATCDAVLMALAARGFVTRGEPDLRYTLGPSAVAVGDAARVAGALPAAASPVAEELARATRTCVALVTRDGAQTRVERVFDHGPAFGVRARVGESVPLVPPFGAVFVAWDPEPLVERWLDRAPGALTPEERGRYRVALAAVRARGFSVGVADARPDLAGILEELLERPDAEDSLRARDAAIHQITHSEYLAVALDGDTLHRVNQMSAPVFDRHGHVAVALMVLGPNHGRTADDVVALGGRLLRAACDVTMRIGGAFPLDYPSSVPGAA
jgi:DNA-binding IclR family transcriptional regulator